MHDLRDQRESQVTHHSQADSSLVIVIVIGENEKLNTDESKRLLIVARSRSCLHEKSVQLKKKKKKSYLPTWISF